MGIRKVMVSDITDSTAKVTWETDLDATTELELWEKDQNGN